MAWPMCASVRPELLSQRFRCSLDHRTSVDILAFRHRVQHHRPVRNRIYIPLLTLIRCLALSLPVNASLLATPAVLSIPSAKEIVQPLGLIPRFMTTTHRQLQLLPRHLDALLQRLHLRQLPPYQLLTAPSGTKVFTGPSRFTTLTAGQEITAMACTSKKTDAET